VCCGKEFVGKSIGPHYKNSEKCALFKKEKNSKVNSKKMKEPLEMQA
jgi:hypothetical protein